MKQRHLGRVQSLCVGAVALYCVLVVGMLRFRGGRGMLSLSRLMGAQGPQSPDSPLRPAEDVDSLDKAAAKELLCLPSRTQRLLLVEVPFTAYDLDSLAITMQLWEHVWPCYDAPLQSSRPDLVFGFNGNLSAPMHASLLQRVQQLSTRPVLQRCFGKVTVESACLSGADDTYDKRRLNANWTAGPNNLFVHFLRSAATRGYRFMVQLEPDVLPVRRLWLEQLTCLASQSSAWVIGSQFLSHCAHDSQTQKCVGLGEDIKFHINGNALYAVGDATFRAYYTNALASRLSLWPFDLALHMYASDLPDVSKRRLASKFLSHPYILNFGSEPISPASLATAASSANGGVALFNPPHVAVLSNSSQTLSSFKTSGEGLLTAVGKAFPYTFLLHSSWAMAQLRKEGVASFGAALGITPRPAVPAVSTPKMERGETLLSLATRLADEQGRLLLTFATAMYDPLCRNFVAHTKRLRLKNYLLVTFTKDYHARLVRRGETPHLHELALSSSGGSDVFASRDFFTINAARYTVLTQLLRAGLHIFSMDLDVVLLSDPFPHVWSLPYDLLLQSDARDANTLAESNPFLLRDRLLLPNASNVTYVNGGVFFARGTHAVARLFEDTWSLTSQDLGSLNEQDCLNRMLLASSLSWAPLSPFLFPNGYVYFRRPSVQLEPLRLTAPAHTQNAAEDEGPVLLHCNWINGIPAKRYLLREARVWVEDAPRSVGGVGEMSAGHTPGRRMQDASATRYLAYTLATADAERSLGGQVRALRKALALAQLSNRTLILPRVYILPPGQRRSLPDVVTQRSGATSPSLSQVAAADTQRSLLEGRRTITYFFEYAPLLRHFPSLRESSLLQVRWGSEAPPPQELPRVAPGTETDPSHSHGGDARKALRNWLHERGHEELLHVRGLHRIPYHMLLGNAAAKAEFDARVSAALQPAPELRIISHHIVTKILAHVHHTPQPSQQPLGGVTGGAALDRLLNKRKASSSAKHSVRHFNCLHLTAEDLAAASRVRAAAASLPVNVPTLIVSEVGAHDEENLHAGQGDHLASTESGAQARRLGSRLPQAVFQVLRTPLDVSDFYPYWDEVEVNDAVAGHTLAFDMVQQLVCSAAQEVHGNARSEFLHAVCQWRRSGILAKFRNKQQQGGHQGHRSDGICQNTGSA